VKTSYLMYILLFLAVLSGCSDKEINLNKKQSVELLIQNVTSGNEGGRIEDAMEDATDVVVTIQHQDGRPTEYTSHKMPLYHIGGAYTTEKLSLLAGSYQVTEFFLVDANNNILLATPVEGSTQGVNVSDPLPVLFNVVKEQSQSVNMEVVSTENMTPEDFGLARFVIEEVPVLQFWVSVSELGTDDLIATNVTVSNESGSYTITTPVSGNLVNNLVSVKGGFDKYRIQINAKGYELYDVLFPKKDLEVYKDKPLVIELKRKNGQGLYFTGRFVSNPTLSSIYYLNDKGEFTSLFNDNVHRHSATVSGDKTTLAYVKEITKSEAYICTSDLDGSNEKQIWQIPTSSGVYMAHNLDWHPSDAKLIFYYGSYRGSTGNRDGDVWELDMNTFTSSSITTNFDYQEREVAYSPDGTQIVYSYKPATWFDWPRHIYTMDADGTNKALVADDTGFNNCVPSGSWPCDRVAANPEFSPDGNTIIFDRANNGGIYTVNKDGSGQQRVNLSSGGNYGYHATYNLVGDKIAFTRDNKIVIAESNGNVIEEYSSTLYVGFSNIFWVE